MRPRNAGVQYLPSDQWGALRPRSRALTGTHLAIAGLPLAVGLAGAAFVGATQAHFD